jgi:hypothetical protein
MADDEKVCFPFTGDYNALSAKLKLVKWIIPIILVRI